MNAKEIKSIQKVLAGKDSADLVILNGRIMNVFTNEIEDDKMVAIKGRMIFYVGMKKEEFIGEGTKVIDALGVYLLPGFIEGHTHLDSMIPFDEFAPYALRGGVTTVISECAMVANACGLKGVLSFVNSTKEYPLKTFFLAPPLVPPLKKFESAHPFTFKDFVKLLQRPDFIGIGEAYWNEAVLNGGDYFKKVEIAKTLRKTVEGHAAGAREKSLFSYLNCGITSCHESITVAEALEKLRQGLYVMIREGFIRRELDELHKLKDYNIDKRRLMLVSDVFNAEMLMEGYLNLVVKRAVDFGFDPIEAIKMVTINVADYFGLSDRGAIAVGRIGDICLVDDLREMKIRDVIADGKLVVKDGKYIEKRGIKNYGKIKNSLSLKKVKEKDLYIYAKGLNEVTVMEIFSPTIMKKGVYKLKAGEGRLNGDISQDILPVYILDRRKGVKSMGKGFVKGTGIKRGSVATTLIWDTCNVLAIGVDEKDIALAINILIDMGGGWAVVDKGKAIFKFPMPFCGLIPNLPVPKIAEKEKELEKTLQKLGCKMNRPFLNIQTIAFTGLPFLRITNKGLVDIKEMKKVPLLTSR